MKRSFIRVALFLPLLMCLLGADSIGWGTGEPNPNPGGQANELEGAGSYAVDPANTFSSVYFGVQAVGSLPGLSPATAPSNQWTCTTVNATGMYDCWGVLTTTKGGMFNQSKTSVVRVSVK